MVDDRVDPNKEYCEIELQLHSAFGIQLIININTIKMYVLGRLKIEASLF